MTGHLGGETVAVTGAGGFLGRNVVDALVAQGRRVLAVDRRHGHENTEQVTWVTADVTDREALTTHFVEAGVTDLVHLAAVTPRPGEDNPAAITVNIAGAHAVLTVAARLALRRVVVISSSAVFGDRVFGDRSLQESDDPAPTSLYGITKVAAEQLVALTDRTHGGRCVVLRVPALFGPYETETPDRALMSPPLQLLRSMSSGAPTVLTAAGARDWTYAPDIADAIVRTLTARELRRSCYHLGCGRTWPLTLLADIAAPHFVDAPVTVDGTGLTIDYGDDLHRTRVALDSSMINQELAVDQQRLFRSPEDACHAYVRWWLENPEHRHGTADAGRLHTSFLSSSPGDHHV